MRFCKEFTEMHRQVRGHGFCGVLDGLVIPSLICFFLAGSVDSEEVSG